MCGKIVLCGSLMGIVAAIGGKTSNLLASFGINPRL
jgi:hypothetical protein